MKWITREHPKIDRLACPWLIKRFIDKEAEIIYAPFEEVLLKAETLSAIPFDFPGVEFSHCGDKCTFDYFLKKYQIKDPALYTIATVVRGADTDRHDLASECSGLWAISAGLAYNVKNDYELLEIAMLLYDGLFSWAKHLQNVQHTKQPFENLLVSVLNKYLKEPGRAGKKIPVWAIEIKEIIQGQVDSNISLSLKEISKALNVHPSYLSRQFSKYFGDMSFGEYIRKIRIEKAIQLMEAGNYSLTEIAYLTGFSDQSHFTRIFKKNTGKNPSEYKKTLVNSNFNTKG